MAKHKGASTRSKPPKGKGRKGGKGGRGTKGSKAETQSSALAYASKLEKMAKDKKKLETVVRKDIDSI